MSADRQRLKSAIRRIALTPEERRQLLGDGKNKGGQPGSAGVGVSTAEESRQCCDGGTSSNANPGTSNRDPGSDGAGQDGLNPDDPAKLDNGPGSLTGVTNCATGEPICFDGEDWTPPDGWDAPQERPMDETYVEGQYYYETANDHQGPTHSAVAASMGGSHMVIPCGDCTSGMLTCHGTGYSVVEEKYPTHCITDIYQATCAEGSTADYCNPTDDQIYLETAWPADNCTNLSVRRGTIIGSKYDPENDGSYNHPRSEIELCDGSGNKIGLKPAANGGWKTLDLVNGGDGYLYNASGEQVARISGDEYSDPNV